MPVLVYFHGGCFVAGTLDMEDSTCRALANAGECVVVAADYRLAPEHRFPAAVEDAYAATAWVAANARNLGIDLGGLPPALVMTAEYDPLRDEGERYAERLREAGVAATVKRYDGAIHAFFILSGIIDQGKQAIRDAGDALRRALHLAASGIV